MGCHMWLYKKASSLSRDEQLSFLKEIENYNRDIIHRHDTKESFIGSMLDLYEDFASDGDPIDSKWGDEKYLSSYYDEERLKIYNRQVSLDKFLNDSNSSLDDFINLVVSYVGYDSNHLRKHNDEWYIQDTFDTYFRCFQYMEDVCGYDSLTPIDNYTEMIAFLENVHPNMIECYGYFDDNNKFISFDKPIKWLSDELKTMLKYLYKNNDIFIEFG